MSETQRRTRIVATLGPASQSVEMIGELIDAGVNVFRLNFSHGTQPMHGEAISNIRRIAEEKGKPIAILQDLQGPKIRTGELADHQPVQLFAGQCVRITTDAVIGTSELISTTYVPLPRDVRPGDEILLDDGRIQLNVVDIGEREIATEVAIGGLLGEHKGMNLPHTPLSAPSLTEKDLDDLRFGVKAGVDYVGLSFVRQAEDIEAVRRAARAAGREVPVIAKIERTEAIRNLEEIVAASDGVMVARGDLAVETSSAEVPLLQKRILAMAGRCAKPDITATQMLETMVSNPRPSRAEATDVANAIFDGTDALMLSAETAVGKYPVAAVRTMARIALTAEAHLAEYGRPAAAPTAGSKASVAETTAHAACVAAREIGACGIALFTRSGKTAALVAALRPEVQVVAFTPYEETYRRMALAWGVQPVLTEYVENAEELEAMATRRVRESEFAREGDLIVMLTGTTALAGATNTMRILEV